MPRATLEREIKSQVLRRLSEHGVFAWNNPTGTFHTDQGGRVLVGIPGAADVVGILAPSGRGLAVETKTATGKLRDTQHAWRSDWEASGGVYVVARCAEDVDRALNALGYTRPHWAPGPPGVLRVRAVQPMPNTPAAP